jgi:hypothetical protein
LGIAVAFVGIGAFWAKEGAAAKAVRARKRMVFFMVRSKGFLRMMVSGIDAKIGIVSVL